MWIYGAIPMSNNLKSLWFLCLPECFEAGEGYQRSYIYFFNGDIWVVEDNGGLINRMELPWWLSGKESACQCKKHRVSPCVRKIPCRRKWHPTPVSLPGKFHGQRSLAGYSPWGRKESDTTERLHLILDLDLVMQLISRTLSFCKIETP